MSSKHASAPARAGRTRALAWLAGPLFLAAAVGGVVLARAGGGALFGVVLTVLVGACLAWVVTSVFFPAVPDRDCPGCGASALVRSDPGSMRGVRCEACGFADAAASSFLMAEEDGPLEPAVLAERRARRRPARGASR